MRRQKKRQLGVNGASTRREGAWSAENMGREGEARGSSNKTSVEGGKVCGVGGHRGEALAAERANEEHRKSSQRQKAAEMQEG
eukprot:5484468-Pleurochrysis_carterae.AAC.1